MERKNKMKKEQDFTIIPERYIFEVSEAFTIEKNKNGICINGEQKELVRDLKIYEEDNKIIVETNRYFTDRDYSNMKESIE